MQPTQLASFIAAPSYLVTSLPSILAKHAHQFNLPRIVSRKGIEAPLPIPMTVDEETALLDSAERIRDVVRGLGY